MMQPKNPQISEIMRLSAEISALTPEARAGLLRESGEELEAAEKRHGLLVFLCQQPSVKSEEKPKHPAPQPGVVVKPTTAPAPTRPAPTKIIGKSPAKKTAPAKKHAAAKKTVFNRFEPIAEEKVEKVFAAVKQCSGAFGDIRKLIPKGEISDQHIVTSLSKLKRHNRIETYGGKGKATKYRVKPG